RDKSPKTVNNVLCVLSVPLKQAVEWGVLERLPCSIRLMQVPHTDAAFHDVGAYERLLVAAQEIDHRSYVIALLGGEVGLRAGEIVALEWEDVDLERVAWCARTKAHRSRGRRPGHGCATRRSEPRYRRAFTSSTRSARTWRCRAHRCVGCRSWSGIRAWR
ncbi:MAG: hypothetical protein OEW19_12820, partial [Acidobacteriota bacterium]|nr:hypothetical protein [Acidobacteriota bacterium]